MWVITKKKIYEHVTRWHIYKQLKQVGLILADCMTCNIGAFHLYKGNLCMGYFDDEKRWNTCLVK